MRTDKELAEAVRMAVKALNDVANEATKAGLDVDIALVDMIRLRTGAEYSTVRATVRRLL